MEKLITAEEIKTMQKINRDEKINAEIKNINEMIVKCASDYNKRYIDVHTLSNNVEALLKKAGYTVKYISVSPIEYVHRIFW